MDIRLGDLPTWVAAIGTAGTLSAAVWQIGVERKRRIAQEATDREERRHEQARLVTAWVGREEVIDGGREGAGRTPVFLANGSSEAVYNAVVTIVTVQGAAPRTSEGWKEYAEAHGSAPRTTASIVPPGRWWVWIRGSGWSGAMALRAGAEVAFTDRAGGNWIRRASGKLEELPEAPLAYFERFGFFGPHDLVTPQPVDGP